MQAAGFSQSMIEEVQAKIREAEASIYSIQEPQKTYSSENNIIPQHVVDGDWRTRTKEFCGHTLSPWNCYKTCKAA